MGRCAVSRLSGGESREARRRPRGRARGGSRREIAIERVGFDGGLMLAAGLLIGIGVVMSYSTTAPLAQGERIPPLFLHHLSALAAGTAVGVTAAFVPVSLWHRAALPLWLTGLLLLIATAIFGVEVNGAQRWLPVAGTGFRFQPVEPVKFATLLAVAAVIAPRDGHSELSRGRALAAMSIAAAPIGLLLLQPDLGNAVVLGLLVALMLLIAGMPLRALVAPALVSLAGIGTYIASNPYAMRRIVAFRDPWNDPLGAGFQLIQSFAAFSHGAGFGVGLGNGRQKLFYLPEAHTDFILALVAEELGLLGVLLVLGAFAAMLVAGTRIARRAQTRFGLLVVFGCTALLTVPALINAAVVMGLVPTKGLTLPFLSYGGTSLVMCCAVLGGILGIARSEGRGDGSTRGMPWR